MIQAQNKVIRACDLTRGMVVLPYLGSTFQKTTEHLDWTSALHAEWWTHIVVSVDLNTVTLARPYAYAHEHFDSNGPLLGCENYSVPRDSDCPYMLIRDRMTT